MKKYKTKENKLRLTVIKFDLKILKYILYLKNNCHLAVLKLIQNAVSYTTYAPLPFE